MNKRMPDFLIIGAAKSGTTSLYFYLQQHPQVFLPINKEPFFFSFVGKDVNQFHYEGKEPLTSKVVTDIDNYTSLFQSAPQNARIGEASTLYLVDHDTPQQISRFIPNVKLIAILRNPVDRAYSHYQHFFSENKEPINIFLEAIKAEPRRKQNKWFPSYFYQEAGFYSKHLNNYYSYFDKSQIKVFLYEDLADADKVTREIFEFIGITPDITLNTTAKYNVTGKAKFPWLYYSVRKSNKLKNILRKFISHKVWNGMKHKWDKLMISPYESISKEDRLYLQNIYKADILQLQDVLQRDLKHWLD